MNSGSLNKILTKISTELCDFIFAAYNLLHIIYFTASCLFTFVCQGTMHAEFNSVVLFTVLYSRFQHCAKDLSNVTAQPTILESVAMPRVCVQHKNDKGHVKDGPHYNYL